ncbi:hypothetical protein HAX54_052607 [Datura stramonium]|uniref:Uncharacterized protein n=1 Tax=Datura stramonium TaxID=4076 RepID=A0ABS8T133_DATST|nr:hypothetical protein [Datura stramonium]
MADETSLSPSTEGNQLSDNLILDASLSSNPSSSPRGTDTQPTLSSKMHYPKAVPVNSTAISPGNDNTGGDEAGVAADSSVVAKEGTDVPQKEGSDFSTKNMFEGALTKSKEGTSNILQSEAEIIEGFITALGIREKDVGEESPSAEGSRPGSDVGNCPFIHESGKPSSQEALPVVASPKWDGTPTQPYMEIPETSAPYEIAAGTSSPPDDNEVPIHLVFKRKSRTASRITLQRSIGTQGGPATRGTVKKSLDLILEESRQNTLKRRQVTRKTVLDKGVPSYPIVDLDTATPSQPTDESPNTEKKVHRSGGVSKKGKKLVVVEKPAEGPSAPVLRSKRKHFIAKSSKGKRTANAALGGDVKEQVANIKKQKCRGTEEIECLTMLVAQKDAEIVVLKASQSSAVPGALLDLQEENALLKSDNVALKKQLKELTQQMICDQHAANERIDKLLARL